MVASHPIPSPKHPHLGGAPPLPYSSEHLRLCLPLTQFPYPSVLLTTFAPQWGAYTLASHPILSPSIHAWVSPPLPHSVTTFASQWGVFMLASHSIPSPKCPCLGVPTFSKHLHLPHPIPSPKRPCVDVTTFASQWGVFTLASHPIPPPKCPRLGVTTFSSQ
ncbi:hypothetical protein BDR07DRAFT_1492923 [Suillus spraguei]|nr:hypothetical protein BDR07DRAFT_1492923 [Suillus spraguei]